MRWLFAFLILMALVGCSSPREPYVFRDPDNGCEYLVFDGSRELSVLPRVTPDGKQICPRQKDGAA